MRPLVPCPIQASEHHLATGKVTAAHQALLLLLLGQVYLGKTWLVVPVVLVAEGEQGWGAAAPCDPTSLGAE